MRRNTFITLRNTLVTLRNTFGNFWKHFRNTFWKAFEHNMPDRQTHGEATFALLRLLSEPKMYCINLRRTSVYIIVYIPESQSVSEFKELTEKTKC